MAKELKQYEKEIFVDSKASPRFKNEHVLIPDTASNELIFFYWKTYCANNSLITLQNSRPNVKGGCVTGSLILPWPRFQTREAAILKWSELESLKRRKVETC